MRGELGIGDHNAGAGLGEGGGVFRVREQADFAGLGGVEVRDVADREIGG
ncbi:MAG TPA: hypothetical protein VG387_08960 [Rhizomicrobium sp.]|nr:hypothetical protein [Rhizomicrobium sp.]